jgi:hypothetical protein
MCIYAMLFAILCRLLYLSKYNENFMIGYLLYEEAIIILS